jgi:hypothetical protein
MCIEEKSARMPNSRNALTSTHALEIENPNGKRLWNVNLLTAPRLCLRERQLGLAVTIDVHTAFSVIASGKHRIDAMQRLVQLSNFNLLSVIFPCLGKGRAVAFTECGS